MMKKLILLRFLILIPLFNSMAMAKSHHPQTFLRQISGKPHEGEAIVKHFCSNCHAEKPLISLGAPRIGVIADWNPRLKQGMHVMFQHTEEGFNAMPARGGCFECSDEQLKLAILAMLPKLEKNNNVP